MSGGFPPERLAYLRTYFIRFAEGECRNYSPLYEQLALAVSQDDEVLALAAEAQPGQPASNLLLAAVQFLLFQGRGPELAAYYPSIVGERAREANPYPAFRAFCLEHRATIAGLLRTRKVQTNEVGRCAALLPSFAVVARRAGTMPLAMVEVGCSAGLLLNWDRYAYDYGRLRWGDAASPVRLSCVLRGDSDPALPGTALQVAERAGLDLNPLDARSPDDAAWLRALVWPEHKERMALLQAALGVAAAHPLRLFRGDAVELLPSVLGRIPANLALCTFDIAVIGQFTPEMRGRLDELLTQEALRRPVFRITMNGVPEGGKFALHLLTYGASAPRRELLAYGAPHGQWLEWVHKGN